MNSLFTQERAELSLLFQRHNRLKKSKKAYLLLIIFTITSLLALPWIEMDVITTSPGVIVPPLESIQSFATSTGRIVNFNLEEGQFVRKGDTLFSIKISGNGNEHFILSPADGYFRNMSGLSNGAPVKNGDCLLEILPESELIVQCFLPGEDVVSIQPEQEVEFRVQPRKERGIHDLKGKVKRILPLINSKEQSTVFEVRCAIDSVKGTGHSLLLKPGMTLLARFRLARRSAVGIILKEVEETDQFPT